MTTFAAANSSFTQVQHISSRPFRFPHTLPSTGGHQPPLDPPSAAVGISFLLMPTLPSYRPPPSSGAPHPYLCRQCRNPAVLLEPK
ncbi:hypothetical protein Hypma_002019 [Hypsizygus marmoreus]|uniref:Uncharacterized protein n=1 Tax=Hypsizygus marmoreus TaxID=39966 RepID=A0A369J8W4_HYPMA|nr:hypothetical protein Hypma_002019 [Hypsizygus marmoreus]